MIVFLEEGTNNIIRNKKNNDEKNSQLSRITVGWIIITLRIRQALGLSLGQFD
jgi:hypothetical protein